MILFLIFQNLFGNVNRPLLALLKVFAYIFADDSNAEKLHTAKSKDQYDYSGIAGNVDTGDQFLQHDADQVDQRCKAGEDTEIGRDPQRLGGETDDPLHSIIHQLTETPFGFSGHPRAGGVGDICRFKADPGEKALGETVIFTQLQNAVADTLSERAEIAGIVAQLYIRHSIDNSIKTALKEG